MNYSKRNYLLNLGLILTTVLFGCATPKYSYHTAYKLTSCGQEVSRENVVKGLVHKGFLRSSEVKGPYDIFHKPLIIEKGKLASEKYEDKSGEIAVAVCGGGSENYVLVEEWRGCKDRKDCTLDDQKELRKLAEDWGCQVSQREAHSKSWSLEDRQDWTKESCSFIATNLIL